MTTDEKREKVSANLAKLNSVVATAIDKYREENPETTIVEVNDVLLGLAKHYLGYELRKLCENNNKSK